MRAFYFCVTQCLQRYDRTMLGKRWIVPEKIYEFFIDKFRVATEIDVSPFDFNLYLNKSSEDNYLLNRGRSIRTSRRAVILTIPSGREMVGELNRVAKQGEGMKVVFVLRNNSDQSLADNQLHNNVRLFCYWNKGSVPLKRVLG